MRTFLMLATLAALTVPAHSADLWIDETGDFYIEKTPVTLSMFSELAEDFPRTDCTISHWPTEAKPAQMRCDNGHEHRVEAQEDNGPLIDGAAFYKVD